MEFIQYCCCPELFILAILDFELILVLHIFYYVKYSGITNLRMPRCCLFTQYYYFLFANELNFSRNSMVSTLFAYCLNINRCT